MKLTHEFDYENEEKMHSNFDHTEPNLYDY